MDTSNLNKLLKIASDLDKQGMYKKSDKIFIKLSQYYPQSSAVNFPYVHYVEYDELEDEFYDNLKNYYTKKPNLVKKQYFDLTSEDDTEEGENIEAKLHGPDSVPGPANIDPGNQASNPGMSDLEYFSWEEAYENNPYRRIPRR